LFDLFLDFLLIGTIPGESSFKSEPYSASNHSGHSQRLKRHAPDGVSFVKQVLRGDERFYQATDLPYCTISQIFISKSDLSIT